MSTPSETIRRAAESLRDEATTADDAFETRDWETHAIALERLCEWGFSDSETALLVADWLDVERVECDALAMHRHNDGSGVPLRDAEREVYRNHPALALAEHINGRTDG